MTDGAHYAKNVEEITSASMESNEQYVGTVVDRVCANMIDAVSDVENAMVVVYANMIGSVSRARTVVAKAFANMGSNEQYVVSVVDRVCAALVKSHVIIENINPTVLHVISICIQNLREYMT